MQNDYSSKFKVLAQRSASDTALILLRHDLADFTASTFTKVGQELHVTGYIFGSDRRDGLSSTGNGSDEIVAISLLLRIAGQLTSASSDLFKSKRAYAAAALIRQIVEVEYLAWAFQARDKDAAAWLRSTREEREKFFSPRKLRAAALGKFRSKDYGYHCELGGHPVPGSALLFSDDPTTPQLLLSDLLGHTGRIWDNILDWSQGNELALPIHQKKEAMLEIQLMEDAGQAHGSPATTVAIEIGQEDTPRRRSSHAIVRSPPSVRRSHDRVGGCL